MRRRHGKLTQLGRKRNGDWREVADWGEVLFPDLGFHCEGHGNEVERKPLSVGPACVWPHSSLTQ
jgi:hypothetical protein